MHPLLNHRLALAVATVLLSMSVAEAHKPSDSYLRLRGGDEFLTAEWDISLKDLELLIGIDSDLNGDITWGELRSHKARIVALALSHLDLRADGMDCKLQCDDLLVNQHSDGAYAVLMLSSDCPGDAASLEIDYRLLFDVDPTHRGLILYSNGATTSTHVLSPTDPSLELHTSEVGIWRTFVEYVKEGVWHIWIGFDHILFLVSLLLPAVLVREGNQWRPVASFRPACRSVLKIVTVFTIAHSITLWLAVMEYVTLPGALVEATIAFSIIVTAVNNCYPLFRLQGWTIAFVFGLIHGFGFANVLVDLGLSNVALAVSLFGFNVGVELGQLAIVLVSLPFAFMARKSPIYTRGVLQGGSLLIGLIAAIWMYERVFGVEILGF